MARLVLLVLLLTLGAPLYAQTPNVVKNESTVTATVDSINRFSRTVTLRVPGNVTHIIYVDPAIKEFDTLKTGDRVTVRYVESVVVQAVPGAALSQRRDSTSDAQKSNPDVLEQVKAVVVIDSVDLQDQTVVYRMEDGMKARRYVENRELLRGLRPGDRVEVTLTRERAISIERARP